MSRVTSRLRFIEPQLASPVEKPPDGKHWIHEIKHDGYRCQVLLERGQARVFTRNGFDWTDRYPSFARAAANLKCQSAIIDGEAIVQNGNGASDFEALASAMKQQLTASSYMRLICCISMAGTFANKHSLSVEPA